jgi:hypothetical protein
MHIPCLLRRTTPGPADEERYLLSFTSPISICASTGAGQRIGAAALLFPMANARLFSKASATNKYVIRGPGLCGLIRVEENIAFSLWWKGLVCCGVALILLGLDSYLSTAGPLVESSFEIIFKRFLLLYLREGLFGFIIWLQGSRNNLSRFNHSEIQTP